MIKCKTCKISKALDKYSSCSACKSGKQGTCKSCQKEYRAANRERILKTQQDWYIKNKDKQNAKSKENYKENKESYLERGRRNESRNYKTNPSFKAKKNLRSRIYNFLRVKGYQKNKPTQEMIGCSYGDFMKYMESKFTDGMTWENHGEWHIDHIVPLASCKTPEEMYKLCHYTNLQPLWAEANLKKGSRHEGI